MKKTIINLEEILNKCHREAIKGIESIHTKDFPQTYKGQALSAMREACNQVIELCAENARLYISDKQEILKLKDQII